MSFTNKTREELIRAFTDSIRGGITGADTSPGSDYHLMATIMADVFRGNQSQAAWLAKQIFPSEADADNVLKHAKSRGLTQQQAASASGVVVLTATDDTTVQAVGSTLTHADGTVYETTEAVAGVGAGWMAGGDKTVGKGSTKSRILIKDDDGLEDMGVGDVLKINDEVAAIVELIDSITAIDIYPSLSETPSEDDDIVAMYGAVAPVVAQTTGVSTNKTERDTLTLDSPATNFDNSAIVASLSGGGNVETQAELAARCEAHDSQGLDHTPEAIRTIALECPDVRLADAVVFSNFRGLGAHDIVLIGTSGARIVGNIPVEIVQDYVDANTMDDVVVKAMDYELSDGIKISVTGLVGYEDDWGGNDKNYSIADGAPDRVITSSDTEGYIKIGDRVVIENIHGGVYTTVHLVTVTSRVASDIFTYTPALTDYATAGAIYAAGPLTEPIIAAIENYLDGMGPVATLSTDADSDRHECHPVPGIIWNEWMRLSALSKVCMDVPGVDTVTVQAPLADKLVSVQRTYKPQYILVRYGGV